MLRIHVPHADCPTSASPGPRSSHKIQRLFTAENSCHGHAQRDSRRWGEMGGVSNGSLQRLPASDNSFVHRWLGFRATPCYVPKEKGTPQWLPVGVHCHMIHRRGSGYNILTPPRPQSCFKISMRTQYPKKKNPLVRTHVRFHSSVVLKR